MDNPWDGQLQELLNLVPHLEVAHHVPGRIRLRVLPSGLHLVMRSNIQKTVQSMRGILHIRISAPARSIIIDYDQAQLPYDLWQSVAQVRRKPELAGEVALRIGALIKSSDCGRLNA
jgi:hypothetical protein